MTGPRPIKRLLIANRGEIVCRIAATCQAMGIESVTIFAPDDRDLPHASTGTHSVPLHGTTLAQTYLNSEKIIAAARASGADAIHPGYGFLSENALFAEAVATAGFTFIGPPAEVIAMMGDKAESRKLCQSIGVRTVPGYEGSAIDIDTLSAQALKIGYPVLVKAAAGGGGKGMRIVHHAEELLDALASARSEAESAFGDGRLLLEKYLLKPRHIEVQVFSDSHGGHLHLFERECSIQRRYQKIVEESPAPSLSELTRQSMYDAAIKITTHIGYVGAGTVEFILDGTGEFYFLEMNTRLQVEHPVTEMITGLDLVELQIKVAQGERFPLAQREITRTGHALEVRLYAEDPERNFMPTPGCLTFFSTPHLPHVRCENGYQTGNMVSSTYDPMIAKVAAWGKTRPAAVNRLFNAIAQTRITGTINNRNFLMRILDQPDFLAGKTSTAFINEHQDELFAPSLTDIQIAGLAAGYMLFSGAPTPESTPTPREHSAWNHPKLVGMR